MSDSWDKDKVLDRIQKLLASASNNPSQAEAEVAASMAAKLMKKHNIEMADIIAEEMKNKKDEIIREPAILWVYSKRSQYPIWLEILAVAIAKVMDCHAKIALMENATKDWGWGIIYLGYKPDVHAAKMILTYIVNQVERLADEYAAKNKSYWAMVGKSKIIGKKDYKYGMSVGVIARLRKEFAEGEQAMLTNGTALVVVKDALITEKFGEVSYSNHETDVNSEEAYHGHRDSRKVSIKHAAPVDEDRQIEQ